MQELTLSEELTRKVRDALIEALTQHESGAVSDRELDLMLRTLWCATSGLVNKPLMNHISEALNSVKGAFKSRVAFQHSTDRLSVIMADYDDCALTVYQSRAGHAPVSRRLTCETDRELADKFNHLLSKIP